MLPQRSNGDVLPLKGKELRQDILVSTGSTLGYLLPLLVQAYIVLYPLLACVLVVVAASPFPLQGKTNIVLKR